MPPDEQRTKEEEEQTRQVIKKDIEGFLRRPFSEGDATLSGPSSMPTASGPGSVAGSPSSSYLPWLPVIDDGNKNLADIVSDPTPIANQTIVLSKDGRSRDAAEPNPRILVGRVVHRAEQSPANILVNADQNSKDNNKQGYAYQKDTLPTGKIEVDAKYSSSLNGPADKPFESKWRVGGETGKEWGGALYGSQGEDWKAGFLTGSAKLSGFGGIEDTGQGDAAIRAGGEASARAGVVQAEKTFGKEGLAQANGGVDGPYAEAKVKGDLVIGTRKGSPEATIEGDVGAGVYLAEVKGGVGVTITPKRVWDGLVVAPFNTASEWMQWNTRLQALDKDWDWGIEFGVEGKANVGAGAEAKGKLKAWPPRFEGSAKAAAGVGLGAGVKAGVVAP